MVENKNKKNNQDTYVKASEFWSKYSKRKDLSEYSLMNLNPDAKLANEKFQYESNKLRELVEFKQHWNILDLGGGIGHWSLFFSKLCLNVTLVERENEFVEIAKNDLLKGTDIKIIKDDCINFKAPANLYDVVFMSGVTIYLDDTALVKCMKNIKQYLKVGGFFIHRDAYGLDEQFNISNKYSEGLQEFYSAKYRTRSEYDEIFVDKFNMKKLIDIDMYDSSSKKRRWKETDLRIAVYGI